MVDFSNRERAGALGSRCIKRYAESSSRATATGHSWHEPCSRVCYIRRRVAFERPPHRTASREGPKRRPQHCSLFVLFLSRNRLAVFFSRLPNKCRGALAFKSRLASSPADRSHKAFESTRSRLGSARLGWAICKKTRESKRKLFGTEVRAPMWCRMCHCTACSPPCSSKKCSKIERLAAHSTKLLAHLQLLFAAILFRFFGLFGFSFASRWRWIKMASTRIQANVGRVEDRVEERGKKIAIFHGYTGCCFN